MNIVFLVTGVTSGRGLVLIEAALVAAVAFCCLVEALEQIGRVAVVVESDELPALFAVTAFAGIAVPSFVKIVFLVAGRTGCRGLLQSDGHRMAGLAFYQVVGTQ